MRTLGVVLAGGRSSRFGSNKAEALLAGRPLLAHALDALAMQCDEVAVAGGASELAASFPDWPAPDMGPLGGIAGALRHAREQGFDQVLTVPVDSALLPPDLLALLQPGPACLASQPVIGLWPLAVGPVVELILTRQERHSMRALVEQSGARAIEGVTPPANINTPNDLAQLESALRR